MEYSLSEEQQTDGGCKTNSLCQNLLCSHGTFITWIDCNMSETATTRSPDLIMPRAFSREKVLLRLLSMSSEKLKRKGIRPHCRFRRLRTEVVVVNAKMGQSDFLPILAAELQISSDMLSPNEEAIDGNSIASCCFCSLHCFSILKLTVLNTVNALSGYCPMADSPDSIKASALCLTASETSATSALVGIGYSIIDSSNCEATITADLTNDTAINSTPSVIPKSMSSQS
nr:hypothetical protein GOBAR_AA35961 [Ipomoea batatas]